MNTQKQWLIYGATGDTGRMIVAEAVRRGHQPRLAGRSADTVRALAEPLGLQWTSFGLDNTLSLREAVRDASLVILSAGPFEATSAPVVQACLEGGVPYLDIANETGVFEAVHAQDQLARQRGIALVSGVGFGVSTSDALARYVADQVPGANQLEIAVAIYSLRTSAGAAQTTIQLIAGGGQVRLDGQLVSTRLGTGGRRMAFPDGTHTIVPMPLGDLVSSYYTTGIRNITAYFTLSISPSVARLALPVMQKLTSIPAVRRRLAAPGRKAVTGDKVVAKAESPDAAKHSYVWARAQNAEHATAEAWLETGEGYAYTAAATVKAAEEILENHQTGALTPAQAYGADFPLRIEGVRRFSFIHEATQHAQPAGIMPMTGQI